MNEASRSYEHKGYATRRSHLADVLPMEAHKAWSALTVFGWREPVKVILAALVWVAVTFAIAWSLLA